MCIVSIIILFSHATNDCNVFRRQVQSAIGEGRLAFHEMQVDKAPFPVNTMELQQPKVLVRPHQAESTKGKNVVIGDERSTTNGKEPVREVTFEKTPDGKESFKVTVRSSGQGGQRSVAAPEPQPSASVLRQAVRPAVTGGQTALHHGRPKMLKPRRPEIGTWKVNVAKDQGSRIKPKVTFDMLFDKYTKQKAVPSDRPLKK